MFPFGLFPALVRLLARDLQFVAGLLCCLLGLLCEIVCSFAGLPRGIVCVPPRLAGIRVGLALRTTRKP